MAPYSSSVPPSAPQADFLTSTMRDAHVLIAHLRAPFLPRGLAYPGTQHPHRDAASTRLSLLDAASSLLTRSSCSSSPTRTTSQQPRQSSRPCPSRHAGSPTLVRRGLHVLRPHLRRSPPRPARVSTDHCPGRAAGLLYEEVFASDLNRTIFTKETKSPSVFPLSRRPSTELGSGAWFYDELSSTTSCLNLSTRGASYGLLHRSPFAFGLPFYTESLQVP
ncbi:hypothetical protein CF328_g8631 [Tilletia controversa]|nr:hypothetical protein CF328_g8631 [Tilletia controversa]